MKSEHVGLILSAALIASAVVLAPILPGAEPGADHHCGGAASQNFEADTVKWTLNIEEDISGDNLAAGYEN